MRFVKIFYQNYKRDNMLNTKNPVHDKIKEISINNFEKVRVNMNTQAKVMMWVVGVSSVALRDFDYMMLAEQYTEYLRQEILEQSRKSNE